MCKGKNCCGGCVVNKTSKILLIVGGLNWGLVGLGMLFASGSNWNVVNLLLGSWPVVEGIVYVLVGLSAVMKIFGCRCKKCSECKAGCATCSVDDKKEEVKM